MSRKPKGLQHTLQVRLYPTPAQGRLLMAHCQEYMSTVNVPAAALDADLIPHDERFSTKDFRTPLPSCVKNQALRDARSVFRRSLDLDVLPVLKKPLCQKKRGKWIADVAMTLPLPAPIETERVMGIDLGIKVPAVAYIRGAGIRFYGHGRYQRYMRRRFYARRQKLQQAKKTRAVKKSRGKEARWMKNINHQLSRQIVTYAQAQGVGIIKLESLSGIKKGTTRTSRGASARKNNRMQNSWSFSQLTLFISYKAERLGIKVEQVDPAYTSQECPACGARNQAQDRTYVCAECGWHGHRDSVGASSISRRAGLPAKRVGATGATRARPVDGLPETAQTVTR